MGKYLVPIFLVALLACAQKGINREAPAAAAPVSSTAVDSVEEVVIVKTCVNWKGEVVSTEFQPLKSNVTDTTLIQKAIRAAGKYKFEEKQGNPIQCGDFTFKFKLKKQ